MRGVFAMVALVASCAGLPAAGDVVTLNHWDARVNFGVMADGGVQASSVQGPEQIVPGTHAVSWSRVDGVASARAGTDYTLSLTDTLTSLAFSLDMKTDAWAQVGHCPEYPFARGIAEAWFDYAIFDFTLREPAVLTVAGAPLGEYLPGAHLLQPGDYLLEMTGPTGLSSVNVGPQNSAQSGSDFAASFSVDVAPAPAGGLALLGGCAAMARRRRRWH